MPSSYHRKCLVFLTIIDLFSTSVVFFSNWNRCSRLQEVTAFSRNEALTEKNQFRRQIFKKLADWDIWSTGTKKIIYRRSSPDLATRHFFPDQTLEFFFLVH